MSNVPKGPDHHEATAPGGPAHVDTLILYVEDDPLNASLVESIVGRIQGRTLHVESTVAGALAALRSLHPSVVLLDLNLPDGSGFEVLRAVRDDSAMAATPVVMLSADATEQAIRTATEHGADRFITKPFDVREFVALLESYA